jgi:CRP/FNR family transcriptional regulator, cyclic AMP receptor protein
VSTTALIIVFSVIVIAVVTIAALTLLRKRRTERLHIRFGPEYARAVQESGVGGMRTLASKTAKNRLSVLISLPREHGKGFSESIMAHKIEDLFDPEILVRMARSPVALLEYRAEVNIFSQGNRADALYFIREGKVKYTVVSKQGKKAVLSILKSGDFFGVECMAGRPLRMATATAITACSLIRIHKKAMPRLLQGQRKFSEFFVADLLSCIIRYQEELMDCLFNSSEKRLARILLSLTQFGRGGKTGYVVPKLSQQILAQMVGTTRSRINVFMNKFRKKRFVDYDGEELRVHRFLRNVLVHT